MAKKIYVRPGKTQSKVGFGVGIIFCLIGLVVVVPTFGLFGIFWTAIAGWITYSNYRSGFTDKPIDSRVIEIEDDGENMTVTSRTGFETYSYSAESTGSDSGDVEARMKRLQSLYDQALITRDEYERKRKEILEEL